MVGAPTASYRVAMAQQAAPDSAAEQPGDADKLLMNVVADHLFAEFPATSVERVLTEIVAARRVVNDASLGLFHSARLRADATYRLAKARLRRLDSISGRSFDAWPEEGS